MVDPQGRARPGGGAARRRGARVHRGAGLGRRPTASCTTSARCSSAAAARRSPCSRWPATSTPTTSSAGTFELEWPPRSGARKSFPEIDRAGWFDLDTARRKLVPAQAEFIDRLLAAELPSAGVSARDLDRPGSPRAGGRRGRHRRVPAVFTATGGVALARRGRLDRVSTDEPSGRSPRSGRCLGRSAGWSSVGWPACCGPRACRPGGRRRPRAGRGRAAGRRRTGGDPRGGRRVTAVGPLLYGLSSLATLVAVSRVAEQRERRAHPARRRCCAGRVRRRQRLAQQAARPRSPPRPRAVAARLGGRRARARAAAPSSASCPGPVHRALAAARAAIGPLPGQRIALRRPAGRAARRLGARRAALGLGSSTPPAALDAARRDRTSRGCAGSGTD